MQLYINCDMGESFGHYHIFDDEQLMPFIDSCNIACGFHAGDPVVIRNTILAAIRHRLQIGAHPSFPDLQGFGRRKMDLSASEIEAFVLYQISALKSMTEALGGKLIHVKAHGALYNEAWDNEALSEAIAKAVFQLSPEIILYAPYASVQAQIAGAMGLQLSYEGFIDRRYTDDLHLISRKRSDAVISSGKEAVEQLSLAISERQMRTESGLLREFRADTFCIHGDNPAAIEILNSVRSKFPKSTR